MSWITKISIKFKWLTLAIAAIIAGSSVMAAMNLQQELVPDMDLPMTTIITYYPGAQSEEVVSDVTAPLEYAITEADLGGLKHIDSTSSRESSVLFLTFEYGTVMDDVNSELRDIISEVTLPPAVMDLPQQIPNIKENPILYPINMDMLPVVMFTLHGDMAATELEQIATDQVAPKLKAIEDVFDVTVGGGTKDKVLITPDALAMMQRGVSLSQITAVLAAGQYDSIESMLNAPVTTGSELLSAVASIEIGPEPGSIINRTNGNPSISIDVNKMPDANSVSIANAVQEKIAEIEEALPAGLEIVTIYDESEYIESSVSNLSTNVIVGGILAVIVVFVFLLAIRPSIVIAISIPLSLLVSFLAMYFSGITINIMTLSAMVIAVGRVIDNSIVVLEIIHRRMKEGESFKDAAVGGIKEIGMPITSATIATVVIFIPLMFVGGISGEMFMPFGLTITFALIASLLIAVTIIPALYGALTGKRKVTQGKEANNNWHHRFYLKSLKWALGHKIAILSITTVMFLGSFALIPIIGTSFMPPMGSDSIEAIIEMPEGTTTLETLKVAKDVEEVIANLPGVANYNTKVGASGNAMGDISALLGGSSENIAGISIMLNDGYNADDAVASINTALSSVVHSGVITIKTSETASASMEQGLQVNISGASIDELAIIAEQVNTKLATLDSLTEINIQYAETRPDINITLNPARIAELGLPAEAAGYLQMELALIERGGAIGIAQIDGNPTEIYIRSVSTGNSVEMTRNFFVGAPQALPLHMVADVEMDTQAPNLHRIDGETTVVITAETSESNLGAVTVEIQNEIDSLNLPDNINVAIAGVAEDMAESFKSMGIAIGIAILLVVVVLVVTFRSIVKPIIIMVSLPLASIGAMFGLLIGGKPLGITGMMGVLMLVGIVLTNAVVLIDIIEQLRKKGMTIKDALINGGRNRLNPILMTALTTMIAMLPLALGSGDGMLIAEELALVVIGGLFSSTILTLLVIPVLYDATHREGKKSSSKEGAA